MLLRVAIKYGKDSDEYVMAGGFRRPYRRRSAPEIPVVSALVD
jgi:hypothetical protein